MKSVIEILMICWTFISGLALLCLMLSVYDLSPWRYAIALTLCSIALGLFIHKITEGE